MPLTRTVVALACAAPSLSASPAAQSPQLDSVGRYVAAEMKRQQIPGLSVAILRGDSVLLARGYGFSNLEHRVPASDSTIYQSGSLGKQFTGTAVGMLAQQGRLHLDDKITKWLPEGKGVWDSITVRQLLTHTSGIPDYTDSLIDLRKDYTEEELVRLASSQPPDFPPGQSWSYSNTGYLLLGVLIHRVTGRFYGDVLHQLLFSPLGMRTRIISEADIIPNRSAGYRLVQNELKNQEWVSPSLNTTADGSLYLTVNDVAKWAVALKRGRMPNARVLEEAWTPVRLNDGGAFPYGFGWSLTSAGPPASGSHGSLAGLQDRFLPLPRIRSSRGRACQPGSGHARDHRAGNRWDTRAGASAATPSQDGTPRPHTAACCPRPSPEDGDGRRGRHGHARRSASPAARRSRPARRNASEGALMDGIGL